MWPIAVQANLVPGDTFAEKLAILERLGVDGIEVSGADLLGRLSELKDASEGSRVQVASACAGFDGWLVDRNPRARRLAIGQIQRMLEAGEELGIAGLVSPAAYGIDARGVLPPFRHAFTLQEDRELLVDALEQIAASAERTGGTLLLEPLNRYVDRVLNSLAEAASVIDEIGSPHVRMVPDLFHMNIEEADPYVSLERYGAYLAHVHLSDSNRLLPGRGHTDFARAFAALRRAGYEGWVAIECRIEGDAELELRESVAHLRACMPRD